MNLGEAAQYLGIPTRRLAHLVKLGRVPYVKVGERMLPRFHRSDLEKITTDQIKEDR